MASVNFDRSSGAHFKLVKLPVSTGKADAKVSKEFEVEVPASLEDAIKAEGPKGVFRRYVNSLVISLQADCRADLKPDTGEASERKRAPYLETLGI